MRVVRRIMSRFLLILGALALPLAFQNCLPKSHAPDSETRLSGGSGNGYDGKMYARVRIDGACADGSSIESQIQFVDGQPVLIRENCVDLPVSEQRVVNVEIDENDPSYIIYKGVIYVDALTVVTKSIMDGAGHLHVVGTLYPVNPPADDPKRSYQFLAKLNPSDQLIWAYTLDLGKGFSARSMALRPDGSVVVVGPSIDEETLAAVAISKDGERLWSYEFRASGKSVYVTDAVADGNGNVYVGGLDFLLKIDADGGIRWERQARAYMSLAVGPDQSVYGGGGSISRTAPDGTSIWIRKLTDVLLADLRVLGDGSIVAAGQTGILSGSGLAAKWGADGNLVWSNLMRHPEGEAGASLMSINEGPNGFVFAGSRMLNKTLAVRGAIYGLGYDGSMQFSVTHPSYIDGEIWATNERIRVRARTRLDASAGLQSYFLDLVPGLIPTCEHCSPAGAEAESYAIAMTAAPAPTMQNNFVRQSLPAQLRKLSVKLETRR